MKQKISMHNSERFFQGQTKLALTLSLRMDFIADEEIHQCLGLVSTDGSCLGNWYACAERKVSQDALPANSNKANDAVADPNIIDRGVFCCRYCHEDDFDCQAYCDWNIC